MGCSRQAMHSLALQRSDELRTQFMAAASVYDPSMLIYGTSLLYNVYLVAGGKDCFSSGNTDQKCAQCNVKDYTCNNCGQS